MRRALLVLLLAAVVVVGYVVLRDLHRGYRSTDGATLTRFTLHSQAVGRDLHEILVRPARRRSRCGSAQSAPIRRRCGRAHPPPLRARSTTPQTSGGTTCSPRRRGRRSTAAGSGSTWAPMIPSAPQTPYSLTGCSGRTSSSTS